MKDITLNFFGLEKFIKKREQGEIPEIVVGIGQKIYLQRNVICNWKMKKIIEDSYTLAFNFKDAERCHNMSGGYSCYQIQRNAEGKVLLIRVSE